MKKSQFYILLLGIVLLCSSGLGSTLKKTGKNKNQHKKTSHQINQLMSVATLNKELKKPNFDEKFRVLEASLSPKLEADFKNEHIPKAIYFDAMRGVKPNESSPIGFPEKTIFQEYVRSLGVSNSHHVIVYDRSENGFADSTRVWWVFRGYGHNKISVLNGGLKEWKKNNLSTTNQIDTFPASNFTAVFKKDKIRSFKEVHANVKSKKEILIDARGPEDYLKNKIPNSVNIPVGQLFENGTLKDMKKLKSWVKPNAKGVIVSCLKGLRGATMGFVANLLGYKQVALYPGSWLDYSYRLSMLNATTVKPKNKVF